MIAFRAAPMLRSSLIALAISQLFSGTALAATDAERIAALEQKLAQSNELIQVLAKRLTAVEGSSSSVDVSSVAAKTAAQEERIEQIEKRIVVASENSVTHNEIGLPLHGFADVGYANSSNDPKGRKGGFTLGTLDLYLTPTFGDRVKSIVELAFEYDGDGGLATDLERLQFGYTFSDAATVWAGRFHTPYGYWNTAFHHGPQIQTSITRPRFISFEDQGGILPAHGVGVLTSGQVRAGDGKVQYDAYVANGNSIKDGTLDFNAVKDSNTNKMVGGNLRYVFGGALDGLTIGAHGLTQKVDSLTSGVLSTTKVNMMGGFMTLDRDNWEVMSEYYRFHNTNLSGGEGSHNSWAGFAQAGYTFGELWTPFVRFEKASLDQGDNYFALQDSGRSYKRTVAGMRYNLNPLSAVKVELSNTKEQGSSEADTHEARVQFAVRF